MVKNMSNYWKRPEQHNKVFDYVKDREDIKSFYRDLPFTQESYIYKGQITPDTMIKEKEAYEITMIHPLLIINGLCITVENGRVLYVNLFGIHPNKDPNTGAFCLPEYKLKVNFTEKYFHNLIKTIKTYYLDNSFITPPSKYVTYKKLKSVYIQLNQGDDNG